MLSSISEGFPFTLIEAMTCGRATVSTDVGGVARPSATPGWWSRRATRRRWPRPCLELLRDDRARHGWARPRGCG